MKKVVLLYALFFFKICHAQTISSLWNEYQANPYNHPNIPNNSYAGYGTGIVPLPNPSAKPVNVTLPPYNAVPGDTLNDQPSIQAAIDAVGTTGGGIVYLPAGNYVLNKPLFIKYNNVILRGQGSSGTTATILDFRFSLYSVYKKDIDSSGQNSWVWWSTGLVWIGPGDTFKSNGAPIMFNGNGYEEWRFSTTLANVTMPSNAGTPFVTVDNTSSLSVGMKILLCYKMPSDRSFIKLVYGHTPTESGIDSNKYVDDCTGIISPLEGYYYWPASIKSINGKIVTFDRPLRIKVNPALWPATIRKIKSMVTESGIENVQVKGYNTSKMPHLPTPTSTKISGYPTLGGWNGVYINRSWNCWVNNVRFVNLECGVILSSAKNCSVLSTFITSTDNTHWYHHPYAMRVFSSDNLVENFTIDGPAAVKHGINVEWFSSGNVYSKGLMKVGTFDTHRGAPFDLIRTEITVANDAASVSSGHISSGPFAGKRFAHWNIIQKIQPGYIYENSTSRRGSDVFEPLQYPMGAFVAITGQRDNSVGEHIPPPLAGGTLGSVVVTDSITDPGLINLYHAELTLRKMTLNEPNKAPIVSITSPAKNSTFIKPATITIKATATDSDGVISSVRFYNGATYLKTVFASPYSYTLSNLPAGTYSLTAKAIDNLGAATISDPVNISVVADMAPVGAASIPVARGSTLDFAKQPLSLKVNPNPVANILNISVDGLNANSKSVISLISASGVVVKTLQSKALNKNMRLDVSSLSAGMYFMKFVNGDKIVYRQFVKL